MPVQHALPKVTVNHSRLQEGPIDPAQAYFSFKCFHMHNLANTKVKILLAKSIN